MRSQHANRDEEGAPFLGLEQLARLKRERATSKVDPSDVSVGTMVPDAATMMEKGANGEGPSPGCVQDVAQVLSFVKHPGVGNAKWLTADVHFTAAHRYSPDRATFQDFEPFWEFVPGPIRAGTFRPGDCDPAFEVLFAKHPTEEQVLSLPPPTGRQFIGKADISAATRVMRVSLLASANAVLRSSETGLAIA